jgi:UDP-N-acetylmuramoyl-tripeptide--D-alanyl-D-alanine ligase
MLHLHAPLRAARRGAHVERAEQLLPLLEAELRPGDTLLIKGSLGSGMGRLVAGLLAAPALVEG